jgi:hypothetical protein
LTTNLTYEFRNPQGKRIYGRYTVPMPVSHNVEMIYVLYLNDKVHTLL